ncbi:MAG: hypothetical protein II685_07140 [Clostridia bacterium]|nr:hypothetical protein [Clostridia bacterium]
MLKPLIKLMTSAFLRRRSRLFLRLGEDFMFIDFFAWTSFGAFAIDMTYDKLLDDN